MGADLPITFADVVAASSRIAGVVHRTRVASSRQLDSRTGLRVFLACENEQRTGSFKIRGALNRLAQLSAGERARGVVAASSGNHAQGVALAATIVGTAATIFMPSDAPKAKVSATRGYGARVEFYDRETALPADLVEDFSRRTGAVPVPAFDHPAIMAGQGTVALELLAETGPVDAVVVPLGGGGLLSGVATVVKTLQPRARVFGVEPADGDDWVRSLAAGRPVLIDPPRTIADGARTRQPGVLTYRVVSKLVDGVVTVTDDDLAEAVRFLGLRMKLVAEPTGALAVAALLAGRVPVEPGSRVAAIVSGGNVDPGMYARLLTNDARETSPGR
ncbi:MAG: serine/threonine dehydratase [Tepidiforma sp.]|nr:pyridoxal-phosphate dependent enzyme [Tepidiforma sp.]GIW17273.1 MAG: serine/threonine dehydratase [Tepidiforma sp.]